MQCPSCRADVRAGASFCDSCGAPLARGTGEHRKLVTIVFCDIAGSTSLGESTDPEALRALFADYFERMQAIVERHGGTVEKFIGDAVMAVFGVPAVHEDDALRACRAAVEMRDAFPALGIQGRIGVNSGEVVAGTRERLATGDAVNVAARLEQGAEAGEVLIGEATLELAAGRVETEPVDPLTLKGKREPVPAFRLVAVSAGPLARPEAFFVDREHELGLIRDAWRRAAEERRCELVTIVGEAGVGKSRLVSEAFASLDVPVVVGRCLPYGEGVTTYWPVVEVIKQIGTRPPDPAAAASIRSLLRETQAVTTIAEIAWAFGKLLEAAAPIAVVFDDVHWGEETFLDLVERMTVSSGVPILVVCIGRPELRERRPQWPVAAHLEPLAEEHVHELIGAALPAELRDRVTAAAGGNPLFVLEMLALAEKTQAIDVPPTLRALLTARLDQLQPSQRSVLDRAAVEGERFHRGAVEALGEQPVTRQLATLVDRQLIRPARPLIPGEDAFHFRHQLLRDAAYDALPKAARAVMHERLADWLEDRGGSLVELDEIAGYHLEQAVRFKLDLGHPDPGLAMRAGGRLAHAGRRALARADVRAGASLLQRSLELTRPSGVDVALELDLSTSLMFVDPRQAAAIAVEAAERAHAAGDEAGEALARAVTAMYMTVTGMGEIDEVERLAAAALPLVEEAGDHVGLMYAWGLLAWVANGRARFEDMTTAFEQWVHHGRLAGRPRDDISRLCSYAFVFGPRPADEALGALDEILADRTSPGLVLVRAQLLGMLGRFDEAWSIALPASERARELGDVIWAGDLACIASYAGDHARAAGYMSEFCDALERQGSRAMLSGFAPTLGRSLCALGRYDEAEPLAALGRDLGAPDDIVTQVLWRQVQALVDAHRGEDEEAEQLARGALDFAERTDSPLLQGDALSNLAEVLEAAGKVDEAAAVLEQALDRYERKQYLPAAARCRPRLAALRERAPASIG